MPSVQARPSHPDDIPAAATDEKKTPLLFPQVFDSATFHTYRKQFLDAFISRERQDFSKMSKVARVSALVRANARGTKVSGGRGVRLLLTLKRWGAWRAAGFLHGVVH